VIAKSSHLSLIIDGTSDLNQRNPLAIRLVGKKDDGGERWTFPIQFCKPKDHTALTQLNEIQEMFQEINSINSASSSYVNLKHVSVLDLETIVFDSTSSNTRLRNGLAGLLIQKRKQDGRNSIEKKKTSLLSKSKCVKIIF